MTEETTPEVKLSLNDLAVAVKIIDLCSERGSFKGDELSVVGQVRENLAQFVKANTPEEATEEEVTEDDNSTE